MSRVKLKVVDLFAGAGGFGLGFHLSQKAYELVLSLEIDKWAVETLKTNAKDNQIILEKDIRSFDTSEKIRSVCPVSPDIIIGGPPCQGFSIAGPAKDPKDPRNSLFQNYAAWVEELKPKVFVMENVKGILNRKNYRGEKVIDIITSTFLNAGYTVSIWKLNAANYGVPQKRERVFIVGNLMGEKISPPEESHFINDTNNEDDKRQKALTVIEAIGDLPPLKAGEGEEVSSLMPEPQNDYQITLRNGSTKLYNHVTMAHTSRVVNRYQQILDGVKLDELSVETQVRKRNGNGELSTSEYNSNYRHLKPDMISYTIPASFYSNFIHPNQPRNITAREAARLQSFPDDYVFKGKRTQISSKLLMQQGKESENYLSQYNQIGNAVPPLLAKAIANRIYDFCIEHIESKRRTRHLKVNPRPSE